MQRRGGTLLTWLRYGGKQTASLLCRKGYATCNRRELDPHTRSKETDGREKIPAGMSLFSAFETVIPKAFLRVSLVFSPTTGNE